jgi:hypothetical protein
MIIVRIATGMIRKNDLSAFAHARAEYALDIFYDE